MLQEAPIGRSVLSICCSRFACLLLETLGCHHKHDCQVAREAALANIVLFHRENMKELHSICAQNMNSYYSHVATIQSLLNCSDVTYVILFQF